MERTRCKVFSWKIPRKKKSLLWFLYIYSWSASVLVIIKYIVMVSRRYKTNLYTAYKYNCEQCIDPPCSVKCSRQGGGVVSCSPKYIIKKRKIANQRIIFLAKLEEQNFEFESHLVSLLSLIHVQKELQNSLMLVNIFPNKFIWNWFRKKGTSIQRYLSMPNRRNWVVKMGEHIDRFF